MRIYAMNNIQDKIIEDMLPICIFSVDKEGGTAIGDLVSRDLAFKELKKHDVSYKTIQGMYDNMTELSIVVSQSEQVLVATLCELNAQDQYLVVNTKGKCIIYEWDTVGYKAIDTGDFVHVSKAKALKSEGYSYDVENNRYYTIL